MSLLLVLNLSLASAIFASVLAAAGDDESATGVQVRLAHFGKDCIKLLFFKGCLENVTHECYHSHWLF